jgi:PAS domain S-box-containing protein
MFYRLIASFVDPSGLTPHGFCLLWEPALVWTYAISDAGIGIAYFTIPAILAVFAQRRKDLVFRPVFWLFAAFILLCGTSHWLDVLTLWVPAYPIEAVVKATTAVVSLVTAYVSWRLLPQALALPSSSQLQAANLEIARSEARHRASFEQSPIPVYVVDQNDVLTAVSDTWLHLLGYGRADVIGRCIRDFVSPISKTLLPQERRRLLDEGQLLDQEREFQRRDGTVVNALISARVDQQSADFAVVCILVDVTAKLQTEAALRISEEHLRQSQKMEAVGQLTGGIAHDFNNMLQSIGGALDLIDRRITQQRSDEIQKYVSAARKSVERAANLTYRMLAFARRQSLQPTSVEPDLLMKETAELIRRTIGPEVRLVLNLHDGVWCAMCDANQLENSLLNLAINARDAMPDGGTLTISTWDRRMTEADLTNQINPAPGDYIEIAVTDDGAGIDPNIQSRVFEPFFTTKPIGQGTGLGLSQVYGFVQQSGGMLRIESELGQGTTVRLYLPRDMNPEAATTEQPTRTQLPAAGVEALITASAQIVGKSILLVDDEEGVRSRIADALQEIGYQVLEAEDGAAGLDVLRSSARVDLLLTDVGLPSLNGRQLAEIARSLRPALPVIFITGYAGKMLEDLAMGPGMLVIRKPFDLETLCNHVMNAIR